MSSQFKLLLQGLLPALKALAARTSTTLDDTFVELLEIFITNPVRALAMFSMAKAADAHLMAAAAQQQLQAEPPTATKPAESSPKEAAPHAVRPAGK